MNYNNVSAVCVFCGASTGTNNAYERAARDLGTLITQQGLRLVFGAGKIGMMGVVADAVISGGGEAIGVIPTFLKDRELAHENLTELHVVNSMHERKQLMFELSDAFIILPGGLGTLDEAVEIITWAQLGRHNKPIIMINTEGYWEPFHKLIEHISVNGFSHGPITGHYTTAEDPAAAIAQLSA